MTLSSASQSAPLRYNTILETVGNTPVVRINNLGPKHVNLFVKVESFNPMGSVKDRLALGVIEDAERKGELKPGQTIVEATSGNTGIGLAMVCAQKGYPLVVTMAENFSIERRKMLRFLGAKVVLTPASEKGTGMVKKAQELAEKHGWWQSKQFENPANAEIHERTTGPEITEAFKDVGLDYWVSGFGTGGTLNGVARYLADHSPNTKVIVCEPDNSQMLASKITQPENASHPNFRPHAMQGWSPDFISKLTQDVKNIHDFMPIDGNEAMRCARELASKEGIFVGITAGASFYGALKIAEFAPEGSNILCMLPDTGERYLSTPLFDHISSDMNDEEHEISQSTHGFRFNGGGAAASEDEEETIDQEAQSFFNNLMQDKENPVVMFSLEWCEFCWSAKKVFNAYGIPFKCIDLDSVKFQENDFGGKLRAVIRANTGWNTLPQIFIDGKFLGGCTDLFDGIKEGSIFTTLEESGIPHNTDHSKDPYEMLPGWLHPR